jgi:NAD(P) transhydrogenase subunit alpha
VIISVLKETTPGERRVALTPDAVKRLAGIGVGVRVERGAGEAAGFADEEYRAVGAEIVPDAAALRRAADVLVTVHRPAESDVADLKESAVLVGMLQPATNAALVRALAGRKVTAFSLDALPRITRAQSMDILSSMATIAGYKAVLLAATTLPRFFPMLVTAAGTIPPARTLVLGAGVAGLQAIATARRLGSIVQAFDVRPAVKEQVESLGAQFLVAEAADLAAEGAGGYAKELSEAQHRRELDLIHQHVKQVDVVICTAQIPGKRAPVLITEAMVTDMRPGAVIVDLAAEGGGNCELTKAGQDVVAHRVTILGPVNLAASVPTHASQMVARNLLSFLQHLIKDGSVKLDFQDEITAGACITHAGEIRHEGARAAAGARGS